MYAGGSGSMVQVPTGTNETSSSVRCGSRSSATRPQPAAVRSSRSGRLPHRPARGRGALPSARPAVDRTGAAKEPQRGERQHGERDRLHHRQAVVAVEAGRDDLGRHDAEPAAEDVGRAERGERRHERQQRRAAKRRSELRQHHTPEGAPAAGPQAGRRLVLRPVERLQRRPDEQVEVDVHRVGVHQQDRARALQPPRRVGEAEDPLHQQRDEAGLAVEKQEREHADQRRQHRRQRHQAAQAHARPAARSARRGRPAGSRSRAASTTLATEIQRLPQSACHSVGRSRKSRTYRRVQPAGSRTPSSSTSTSG